MLRSEILIELDKCFGVYEYDVVTRWSKLVILIEYLYSMERNDEDYIARLDLSRFILNMLSFDGKQIHMEDWEIEAVESIGTIQDAASFLGVDILDIHNSERIMLLYLLDVNARNVAYKLDELDGKPLKIYGWMI